MREAVIVSTARTPIGKADRGALNNINSPSMMAHALEHAVSRAGLEGAEIEDLFNITGGTISNGHPYGMTGARSVGHALIEGKWRSARFSVVSMCVGGGQGAAGLFEVC